ncbi:MAG: hypothetical protein KatS3mg060_3385 [Dehalococcoidia bacterium]|nr:MAG: hypothetical protein KatS3mg060_3385 [Dehalococcoidia bacterium]
MLLSARAAVSCDDIPMPIVMLNRWTLLTGVIAGLVLQQPLLTTVVLGLLLPGVLFGQRWSPIFRIGSLILARWIPDAPREPRVLMRFNNSIAVGCLAAAQLAFLAGAPLIGWIFAGMVALAAAVALAGFCVGCFLYYQLKQVRVRLAR